MKNGNRHYYEKRLILVSLSCFGAAIYILFNSLIPSLVPIIPITGTVESSDIFIRNIEIRGTKTKEVKLTFNLKEFNKEFSFTQEIEQNYNNQKS